MKTLYVKCGRDRSSAKQLETRIEENEGKKYVVKRPLAPEARQHILTIFQNYQHLQKAYSQDFRVNKVELRNDELVLEYLEGTAVKQLFFDAAKQGMDKLVPLLKKYIAYVKQDETKLVTFQSTQEFRAIFGDAALPEETPAIAVCNFDSIPENIIVTSDGIWNALDYEYVYDFPIPVDLVLYRNLSDLYENHRPAFARCCTEEQLLEAAGIKLPYPLLTKMCRAFYTYIQTGQGTMEAMPQIRSRYEKPCYTAEETFNRMQILQEQLDNERKCNAESQAESKQEKCRDERRLEELQSKNFLLEERVRELECSMHGMTETITQLQARSASLDAVYASRTWRYSHKLVSIGRRFCPPNTVRARIAGIVLRVPLRFEHWLRSLPRKANEKKAKRNYFNQLSPISLCQSENPLVSIIIPVYNQFSFTYRCLKTIEQHCMDIPYEVILADDKSVDETVRITEKVSGLVVVRNAENLRFLRNCNNAAQKARGKYVLFLNNDTEVQENWLKALLNTIDTDETIGMVGSKLIYANGQLQEAGGILWNNGNAWNYGHGSNPENPEYNYVKEVDYISGCSIMIRRSLWEEIKGFDERFAPAYCEDSDLAFEVRAHGYKVVYQPQSVVIHHEGISNGTDTTSGQKQYQIINAQKFYDKWKNVLSKEHFNDAENVFCARDRSRKKPCVLFIDHYTPTYDQDAGSRTVFEYLRLFVQMGYNVKFIPDNFYRMPKYCEALQQLGIEVLYGPEYAQHWKEWIIENKEAIKFVFTNRPHISIKYMDFLREKTNAKIAYYGHDLHFLRELREYELTGDKTKLESSSKWKAIEFALMRKADVAYYPSKIEQDIIHESDPSINVKVLVPYIFSEVTTPDYVLEEREDIMFLGGFNHGPNVDAALWFAKEILPLVQEKLPKVRWHVLGSHPPKEVQALASDTIKVHGFVTDEELAEFYEDCRMSVVPLRYGAGIKGKVVEAMKFGIPVLTTSVGAEGILGAENSLAVEDDPQAFADRLCSLYEDESALRAMSAASCEYIRTQYGPENAMNLIKEDFT